MGTISVQELQRDILGFLRRVEAGESFIVVSGSEPLAEVRPALVPATGPRPFGLAAGQFTVPPDFNDPLPDEVVEEFETQ
jgi:antitoxin (DNA-binding transcriptional repressor) of toxin-antitoxin stability system